MFTCTKKGCGKRAEQVVKLHIYCEAHDTPAEMFATIFACCASHQAPDGDIRYFFEQNWEYISVGFTQRGFPAPIKESATLAWVLIEDYEEYLRKHDGADPNSKKAVTLQ